MAVSAGWLSIPELGHLKQHDWWKLEWRHIWPRQKLVSDAFHLAAFGAAIIQILAFPNGPGYDASELTVLVMMASLYSILRIASHSGGNRCELSTFHFYLWISWPPRFSST